MDALCLRQYRNEFVSVYASKLAKEDFAETFMIYLRYRNSLERFDNRPGIMKKLKAVESAIAVAASKTASHNFMRTDSQ
jgi:hypothetical protein